MIYRFVLETLSERQKNTKSYLISVYWRSVLLTHKFHPFHKFNFAILILISTSRIIPTYQSPSQKQATSLPALLY